MEFLSNYSETYSFGLPVGGPAARILAELALNQIDRLVHLRRIPFCRFADDFYLFAEDESEAFKALVFLSDKLQRNLGLQLQKSKTRLMSSAEFVSTNPLRMDVDSAETGEQSESRRSLFSVSLHFDPYSPTASEDYERLREEISKFPILDIISTELSKSRVNVSLARKIIGTLQFIGDNEVSDAVRTLIENEELLYPLYFNVLSAAKATFGKLTSDAQNAIVDYVSRLIESKSSVFSVDLNMQYAIRLLSCKRTEETVSLFTRLHDSTENSAVRRDIILAMANWQEWIWLSDRKASFRTMTPSERRAFIIASYALKDEGSHWRDHTKDEFSPFEIITRDWIAERVNRTGWELPL